MPPYSPATIPPPPPAAVEVREGDAGAAGRAVVCLDDSEGVEAPRDGRAVVEATQGGGRAADRLGPAHLRRGDRPAGDEARDERSLRFEVGGDGRPPPRGWRGRGGRA